jgi:MoaA/NifB/PqqE/SkfB family radical SAM enzyme
MKCRHCRASALDGAYGGELDSAECRKVIDSLSAAKPMIIWTGGEPMTRDDLPELVRYASSLGIRSVLAPCGMLVTEARLRELKDAGVMACSFSVDGPDKETHDSFRGVDGAWDSVHAAMSAARAVGMPFQVNTVVRKGSVPTHAHEGSVPTLDAIYDMAMGEGASRLDLFFLVPTGRGKSIDSLVPETSEIDAAIAWANGKKVKLTCCPQAGTCIGGRGFAFLSHTGVLQTCGFVQIPCGSIRDYGFDFMKLVESAKNPLGVFGNCRSNAEQASGI